MPDPNDAKPSPANPLDHWQRLDEESRRAELRRLIEAALDRALRAGCRRRRGGGQPPQC